MDADQYPRFLEKTKMNLGMGKISVGHDWGNFIVQ